MSTLQLDILHAHQDDVRPIPEDQVVTLFGNMEVKRWDYDNAVIREDAFREEIIANNRRSAQEAKLKAALAFALVP